MKRIKIITAVFLACIIMLFPAKCFADSNTSTSDKLSALHLEGTNLLDEEGNIILLRGISTHGLTYFPNYVNSGLFEYINSQWGANLVRLPVYSEDYCNGGKKENLRLLYNGIDAATEAGMYVIVDWHILYDSDPNDHIDMAEQFFETVSEKYAGYTNLIYEICNEPNTDTTWQNIKSYAEKIISIIKQNSPNAVIIVGTPDYSSVLTDASSDPITGQNNVMYAFHFYASSHGETQRQHLQNAIDSGLPVFVSECGLTEADGNGIIDYDECTAWFELLEENNLSFAVWSFSNADESSAMAKSYITSPSTLEDEKLTACGQYVKALLLGTSPQLIPENICTTKSLTDLWYGTDIFPLAVFAAVSLLTAAVFFVIRRISRKKNRSYNELLKRTGSETSKKKNNRFFGGKAVLILSTLTSLIYLCWRVFFSIPTGYGVLAVVCNILLLLVELLGFWESLVHYSGMIGLRDYPLPEIKPEDYPHVDIFVATYNEPTEVLRKTLIGCKHIKYPDKDKVHIFLCDDNRRSEMKSLAQQLGVNYFDRPDNKGAKAGNLNCAMARTSSPYVVTFDADMIPQEDFLLKTIPYFVDAEQRNLQLKESERMPLGFIQTPQCFYNPDVFQHNLYAEKRIPNEQDFFYRTIEPARTSSNSVIYGGSNTILSRSAIEAIGGFYTGSITEDFATGLLIEAAGFISLGLPEPLASGLAPSSFAEHIQQRTRWGRGVILTAKKLKFLSNKKLNTSQKMSYLSSVTYWFSPVKNWIYVLAPIMFAVFGIPVFRCTVKQMLIFWLPMFICQSLCLRLISSGSISSKWSGIQETVVMPFLLVPILKESLGISLSTFKVTKKQVAVGKRKKNTKAKIPFWVLSALSVCGIVRVILLITQNMQLGLFAVLFWLIRNLYFIVMCLFLIDGRDSNGENVSVIDAEPICVISNDGKKYEGITTRLTEHSVDLFTDEIALLRLGQLVQIELGERMMHGTVISVRKSQNPNVPSVYTVEIIDFNGNEDEYIYNLYNRTPTLPQSLTRDLGLLPDLWINFIWHTTDRFR